MNEVVWDEAALDELANIWVLATAADRVRIEAAVHQVNINLQGDPHGEGESRAGSTRVTIESPLTVWYHIDDAKRVVIVYHVVRPSKR